MLTFKQFIVESEERDRYGRRVEPLESISSHHADWIVLIHYK